jgi:hypothetical protein
LPPQFFRLRSKPSQSEQYVDRPDAILRLESTFGSPDHPAFQFVSTHPARLVLELTPREWKRLRQVSGTPATT